MKKILIILIVLLIGAGAATALVLMKQKATESEEVVNRRQVLTYPLILKNIPRSIEGQALVQSAQTLTLHSQVNGEVLFSLEGLKDGVAFKKGDLLLSLDSASVDSQLQVAETALLKSLSTMISNLSSQDNRGIISKWEAFRTLIMNSSEIPELPDSSSEWERLFISRYAIPDQYYQWKELNRQKDRHFFYAPFDGLIHAEGLPVGSLVFQGQQIATLIDPTSLESALPLTAEETAYLEHSEMVTVKVYPDSTYSGGIQGRILRMSALLDSSTQTRNVYIGFENPPQDSSFLPGSYAYIEIQGDPEKQAILIPREMLNLDQTISILDQGKLKKIPVVEQGFRGDRVILTGEALKDGQELIVTRLQVSMEGMELEKLDEAEEL